MKSHTRLDCKQKNAPQIRRKNNAENTSTDSAHSAMKIYAIQRNAH